MALFERPPLETLAPAKDRWTPLYLEHGRLEVDDSKVLLSRFRGDGFGSHPRSGTTVTHAAMKACGEFKTAEVTPV